MTALLCLQCHHDGATAMALLCHSVTMMDVTMMAPLYQLCHHDGHHYDGTTVPMLSPRWMSPSRHRCAYSVTMMGATTMALLDQRCHCNGCHCDGRHHDGTTVPTLSP